MGALRKIIACVLGAALTLPLTLVSGAAPSMAVVIDPVELRQTMGV